MELLLSLLKPLFVPLLKLKLTAPHLPEGVSLVRELKPQPAWLSLKYLATLTRHLGSLIAIIVVGGASAMTNGRQSVWLAVLAAAVAVFVFFILGFELVATRVDYELRHYLVGDRSLRVSHGALTHHEVTLSYANVQNIEVNQGPLERLFGIQSLVVSTAGGAEGPGQSEGHRVVLAGLSNAAELRTLMLSMLHQHQDSGLGEPQKTSHSGPLDAPGLSQVREAAVRLRNAAESLAVSIDLRGAERN